MRVLAASSMGGAGHLNPLLPVLAAARRRGDEVLVVVPASMWRQVAETGHRLRLGGEPPERDVAPIREALPVAPAAEAIVLGNRELFGRLAARAMLPAMERAVAGWRPDVVIREPCEYASAAVADRLGIPTAQVAISTAEAERASIEAAAPALEELRPGLAARLLSVPYLTRFPASLDPSPFATTLRFREPEPDPVPLPDWWGGSSEPLVYVTFGSVFGYLADAPAAYRTALHAVARLPVRVLLTVGRRVEPQALGPLPANVHVEAWVEQVDAFGAADAVVSHGGSGTAYGALAAGLPQVVVPAFADQVGNGRRIAAVGAALTVEPRSRDGRGRYLTEEDSGRLTAAVEAALSDPRYGTAARAVAAELAAVPLVDEVLSHIAVGR